MFIFTYILYLMRHLLGLLLFSFLFLACNDDSYNDDLLKPSARKAREFVKHLKKNEKADALSFVDGSTKSDFNKEYEKMYDEVYSQTSKKALQPMSKWKIVPHVMESRSGNYKVTFEEVLIPFKNEAVNDDDPVYLYVGFQFSSSPDIIDFGIMTKKDRGPDGNMLSFAHMFSQKDYTLLNE